MGISKYYNDKLKNYREKQEKIMEQINSSKEELVEKNKKLEGQLQNANVITGEGLTTVFGSITNDGGGAPAITTKGTETKKDNVSEDGKFKYIYKKIGEEDTFCDDPINLLTSKPFNKTHKITLKKAKIMIDKIIGNEANEGKTIKEILKEIRLDVFIEIKFPPFNSKNEDKILPFINYNIPLDKIECNKKVIDGLDYEFKTDQQKKKKKAEKENQNKINLFKCISEYGEKGNLVKSASKIKELYNFFFKNKDFYIFQNMIKEDKNYTDFIIKNKYIDKNYIISLLKNFTIDEEIKGKEYILSFKSSNGLEWWNVNNDEDMIDNIKYNDSKNKIEVKIVEKPFEITEPNITKQINKEPKILKSIIQKMNFMFLVWLNEQKKTI